MKRTRFLEVLKIVTAGDKQLMRAIDYVTGFLVNDNTVLLKRMLESFLPSGECTLSRFKEFVSYIEKARAFLKCRYDKHVEYYSSCVTHSIVHALGESNASKEKSFSCAGCTFPFYLIEEVEKIAEGNHECLGVLRDCREKFKLYMGHRVGS